MPLAAGETFAVSDIYLPAEGGGSQYLLITSVNIGKPDEIADKKAILTSASRFYVSTEKYLSGTGYVGEYGGSDSDRQVQFQGWKDRRCGRLRS